MKLIYEREEAALSKSYIEKLVKVLVSHKNLYYLGDDTGGWSVNSSGRPVEVTKVKPISDKLFDSLEDKLKASDPTNDYFKKVGAKVGKQKVGRPKKVKLPERMGSLGKVKSPVEVLAWLEGESGTVEVSDKEDGLSLMIDRTNPDGITRAFTRGNGTVGQDVSHLLPHIKFIGTLKKGQRIRGEAVVSRKTHAAMSGEFENPRNMASGIINSAGVSPNASKLSFVVHGMLKPFMPISRAAASLKTMGWKPVPHTSLPIKGLEEKLLDYLKTRKGKSVYDIDGLVLTIGKEQIAFKGEDETAIAVVKHIEWNASRFGLLKPVAIFKKGVRLAGVTVRRATAFNAKFVKDNKLGAGAKIVIARSGEVIPDIQGVVQKAAKADLPPKPFTWEWNKSGVDIVLKKTEFHGTDKHSTMAMTHFLTALGIQGAKSATTLKIVESGLTTPVDLIRKGNSERLITAGLGPVQAKNLRLEINKQLPLVDLPTLMYASMKFSRGWGTSRFVSLLSEISYATLIETAKKGDAEILNLFNSVHGLGTEMANGFAESILEFDKWKANLTRAALLGGYLANIPNSYTPPKAVKGTLTGKVFVFSKVRDKDLHAEILTLGGEVGNGITAKTTHLIVPSLKESSSKILTAKERGVKLLTLVQAQKLVRGE